MPAAFIVASALPETGDSLAACKQRLNQPRNGGVTCNRFSGPTGARWLAAARSGDGYDIPQRPRPQPWYRGVSRRRQAWLFWLFAHIYFLIGFRNRLVVLLDWGWAYWSFQRYARVVTGITPMKPEAPAATAPDRFP